MINPDSPENSNETDSGEKEIRCNDTQPASASRNKSRRKIAKKSTRIGKGVREKVKMRSLLHMLLHKEQKEAMSANDGNRRNYCRRVVSGSHDQG